MTTYSLRLECEATDADDQTIRSDVDAVADAFFDDEDVFDQDLAVDIASKTLTFSLNVDASSEVHALEAGIGAVRSALHASGGGTPGWEDHYRMLRQEIEADSRGSVHA